MVTFVYTVENFWLLFIYVLGGWEGREIYFSSMAPNHHDFLGVLCETDEEILTYTSVTSGLPFALLTRRAQVVFIEPCCVVKKRKRKKCFCSHVLEGRYTKKINQNQGLMKISSSKAKIHQARKGDCKVDCFISGHDLMIFFSFFVLSFLFSRHLG